MNATLLARHLQQFQAPLPVSLVFIVRIVAQLVLCCITIALPVSQTTLFTIILVSHYVLLDFTQMLAHVKVVSIIVPPALLLLNV